MRFNLKFLFVVTTIVAIVVAVVLMKQRHEAALELHQQHFSALRSAVLDLTESLPKAIRDREDVFEQLKQSNPLAPGNALSGGHSGTSRGGMVGLPAAIHYRFHYYFPAGANGVASDETTIKADLHCEVDWETLGQHTVIITHHPSDLSRQAAQHIQSELQKSEKDYLKIEVVEKDLSDL